MSDAYFLTGYPMQDYLADRGRTSGHVLTMVDTAPEDYGRWRAGNLRDRHSAAMGRGSYFNDRLVEPDAVASRYAFYPSRNAPSEPKMREVIGPRKGVSLEPVPGEFVAQDASPEGGRLSMMTRSKHAKRYERDFLDSAKGLTIVYPEDQPVVEAMVRAVWRHKSAAELLRPDGFEPEVTIHWTCEETCEPLQARPDGLREAERLWIEVKSVAVKGEDDRLDTLDMAAVARWAKKGWARKSAMLHDGCRARTGSNWQGRWIVVEALTVAQLEMGWEPRVSVVIDAAEMIGSFYTLGREGGEGFRGYIDLIRKAQAMREEHDYRHDCVREVVEAWPIAPWLMSRMENAQPTVQLTGARRVEVVDG